jgi:hypothetical protein
MFAEVKSGAASGARLDRMLVHREQSAVQRALDNLSTESRTEIVTDINDAFQRAINNPFAVGQANPGDRHYISILTQVQNGLGEKIDFGNQAHREAIGNALIQDARNSGVCDPIGSRVKRC